jgi:hypothetical protein
MRIEHSGMLSAFEIPQTGGRVDAHHSDGAPYAL